MTRWALELEYDGTGYVGWQQQSNGLSLQEILETAIEKLAGEKTASIIAGRTDAGVHACAQVAHIDLARDITPTKLVAALNFHMQPHRMAVLRAAPVADDFSARFSAIGRCYRYDILNRPARPALAARHVWHVPHRLDAGAMHNAAQTLLGRHDFSSFRAASCQAKSPLRTLDRLDVARDGDLVSIIAEARSFLHHQVRNMVGTLILVGRGKWPPARVDQVLRATDRTQAGATAPPDGLFLTAVRYKVDPFVAAESGTSSAGGVDLADLA
jgi:tRNA pseudouridine38-40 synthase